MVALTCGLVPLGAQHVTPRTGVVSIVGGTVSLLAGVVALIADQVAFVGGAVSLPGSILHGADLLRAVGRMRGMCGDLCGDVLGVVLDPAEQRRSPRLLPGQPEEVQPGDVGDAPAMADLTVGCRYRGHDPGVVEVESACPDHRIDGELGVVRERDRRALTRPWLEAPVPHPAAAARPGWSR